MDAPELLLKPSPPALPAPMVRAIVQPSPFRPAWYELRVPVGSSLLDILLQTELARRAEDGAIETAGDVVISVGDQEVYQRFWHVCRPSPKALVCIHVVPGQARQAGLIAGLVAITALAIAAPYVAPALIGPGTAVGLSAGTAAAIGAGVGAAISIGGYTALNAFLPYEQPESGVASAQQVNSVTTQSNRLERYARVPVILGTIRVTPNLGAAPYTEPVGNDKYLRMLLFVGQGPLEISEIKVGGVDISEFTSAEIEYEVREGRVEEDDLTLVTRDVVEVNPAATLGELRNGTPQVQTSAENTTEISIDLEWPGGIYHQGSKKRDPFTVTFTLEISPTGEDTWTDFLTGSTVQHRSETHETSNLIRRSYRRTGLTAGQYDVRVSRLTSHSDNNPSAMFWSAIRSFQPNDPRPDKTIAAIALRVKKTGSSTVAPISCLAKSYVLDWNGAAWVEALSNNPASLGRHLLQGSAQIKPVPDERMDLESWQDFHDWCVERSFSFNGVLEGETMTGEAVNHVLLAGRGRLIRPDGRYGVAIDRPDKPVVATVTPRNSFDMRATHRLSPEFHGFRCIFFNEDKDYQPDERLVFIDGITEETADYGKVEMLDLTGWGITDPDLVWRHARYRIAERLLRPSVYFAKQGKRAKKLVPGDLVAYQSDIALIGRGGGRITSVTTDVSDNVTGVTIDADVTMEEGKTYQARVAFVDGNDVDQYMVRPVTTVAGTTRTLTFGTSFPAETAPAIGDELAFGETDLSDIRCLVRDVIPGEEDTAELVLIDEAPEIFDADTAEIPPWTSKISLPLDFYGAPPAVPVIGTININNISHPSQPDAIMAQQLVVHLEALGSTLQPPVGYDVEIKRADQELYQRRYHFPADAAELTIDIVQSDVTYDVRVRAVGRSPRGFATESAWSAEKQIYVPLPQVTFATVARVAGLQLQGRPNVDTFEGPDAFFEWRITASSGSFQFHGESGDLVEFIDPQFAWYEVVVTDTASGYIRRKINTTTPQFIYSISDNKEDSRKQATAVGGSTRPLRRFTVTVTFVDRFGRRGPPQTLTVENPAPAEPSVFISGKIQAINVIADVPDDDDLDGLRIFVGTTSGFDPAAPDTQVYRTGAENPAILIGDQPAGVTRYLRVAWADRFSDQPADLNLSSQISVVIEEPEGPPRFSIEGVRFTPLAASNIVRWTSGTVYVAQGASVVSEAVSAGEATWTTGTLWLYYVRGTGVIQATTNAAVAQQPDRFPIAQYRGGARVTSTTGDIPIANIVTAGPGPSIGMNVNSTNVLMTLPPITTAGNPVEITFSGQILWVAQKTSPSTFAGNLRVTLRIRRNGTIVLDVSAARADAPSGSEFIGSPMTAHWVGAITTRDTPPAGTHTYTAEVASSGVNWGNQSTNLAQGIAMSAIEALY